jgi:hypothetical protein
MEGNFYLNMKELLAIGAEMWEVLYLNQFMNPYITQVPV